MFNWAFHVETSVDSIFGNFNSKMIFNAGWGSVSCYTDYVCGAAKKIEFKS